MWPGDILQTRVTKPRRLYILDAVFDGGYDRRKHKKTIEPCCHSDVLSDGGNDKREP